MDMDMDMANDQLHGTVSDLMQREAWRDAIDLLEHHAQRVSDDFRLSWQLGWCYLKLGEIEPSIEHLRRATELDPTDARTFWAYGSALKEAELFDDAIAALTMSLELRETALARSALAVTYRLQGESEKAEAVYREGLVKLRWSTRMFQAYADYLSETGRPDEAVPFYRQAERLQAEQ